MQAAQSARLCVHRLQGRAASVERHNIGEVFATTLKSRRIGIGRGHVNCQLASNGRRVGIDVGTGREVDTVGIFERLDQRAEQSKAGGPEASDIVGEVACFGRRDRRKLSEPA